jgi:gamma-tubulin complex component 6
LTNRALLHYFFDELQLLYHLNNLRTFYFLATGRFGLGFCSELSRILLNNDDARIIYRLNSMRQILYTSLDQTGDLTYFIDRVQLSTKTNLPNALSLLDAHLFDYFHLNYRIEWPLNIVISTDMLDKYRVIFRFLLRISIVKQVLNDIWIMLKVCTYSL